LRVDLVGDGVSIPKRLITTWIGDRRADPYTDAHRTLFATCLQSWLRLMPEYELVVITLGSLWHFDRDRWIAAQVARGQYIGASNWARLLWLHHLGGIYLDMDVEVVRRFDDLLGERCVVGCNPGGGWVNNAVLAAQAGHPLLLQLARELHRCDPNDPQFGNLSGPQALSTALRARGWSGHDETMSLADVLVLSSAAFAPYHWTDRYSPACIQPETYAVHHWAQSWFRQAGLPEIRCAS
jgi:Glycosyltransferase sugar-binding region containing DXD motif